MVGSISHRLECDPGCRFELAPEYLLERARSGGWRLRQVDPTALAEKLLQ